MRSQQGITTPLVILVIIIGLLVVGIVGKIFFTSNNNVPQNLNSESGVQYQFPVLKALYDQSFPVPSPNNVVQSSDEYLWWVSDDNYNISVPGAQSVVFTSEYQNDGQIEHQDDLISNYVLANPQMNSFYQHTIKVLHDFGFRKNERNSQKDFDSQAGLFGYVEGYEKDGVICTVTISVNPHRPYGGNGPVYYSIDAACSDQFAKAYEEQKPFLEALDNHDAVINIQKQSGDFYRVSVQYRLTGHFAIMKKRGEKYDVIKEGQDHPQCDLMDKYQVPKEIYEECWNSDDNLRNK